MAKVGLIVLDACRNDPFGASASGAEGAARRRAAPSAKEVKPGLGRIGRAENILFAFSAAPGQTASDGADGHSPFAAALAKYLGTDGLEIRSVLTLVQQEVYDKSRGKQLPYVESGLPRCSSPRTRTAATARARAAAARHGRRHAGPARRGRADRRSRRHAAGAALRRPDRRRCRGDVASRARPQAAGGSRRLRQGARRAAHACLVDPEVTRLRQEAEQQLSLGAFDTARARLAEAADIDGHSRQALKENFVGRTASEATTHYISHRAPKPLDYQLAILHYETTLAVSAT